MKRGCPGGELTKGRAQEHPSGPRACPPGLTLQSWRESGPGGQTTGFPTAEALGSEGSSLPLLTVMFTEIHTGEIRELCSLTP